LFVCRLCYVEGGKGWGWWWYKMRMLVERRIGMKKKGKG